MNIFTKLIVASVAAVSFQAVADTTANNPFAAFEPVSYSQEAIMSGSSEISNDVVVLEIIEPGTSSKESQLSDSNDNSYEFEEFAFHDFEPASNSKEALL